ncbi:MAG: hypothetical protein R3C68_08360 [Myxococcota bacterium]
MSKTDLLRERYENADTYERQNVFRAVVDGYEGELDRGFSLDSIAHATVRDVMTPMSMSLPENTSVGHAQR